MMTLLHYSASKTYQLPREQFGQEISFWQVFQSLSDIARGGDHSIRWWFDMEFEAMMFDMVSKFDTPISGFLIMSLRHILVKWYTID